MNETNEQHKTEQSILCPTNPYAATKAGAELIAQSYNHSLVCLSLSQEAIMCTDQISILKRSYPDSYNNYKMERKLLFKGMAHV